MIPAIRLEPKSFPPNKIRIFERILNDIPGLRAGIFFETFQGSVSYFPKKYSREETPVASGQTKQETSKKGEQKSKVMPGALKSAQGKKRPPYGEPQGGRG